jgi:hypothetical protein
LFLTPFILIVNYTHNITVSASPLIENIYEFPAIFAGIIYGRAVPERIDKIVRLGILKRNRQSLIRVYILLVLSQPEMDMDRLVCGDKDGYDKPKGTILKVSPCCFVPNSMGRRMKWQAEGQKAHKVCGGEMVSTGLVRGCWRAEGGRISRKTSGNTTINGEYNYAMAA